MTTWSGADTVQRPRRRRRGGARPRHAKGLGDHHRLHAALLLRRPGRGRETGDRGSLAQPDRGRCDTAGRDRLHETSPTRSGPRSWASSSAVSRGWRRPASRSTSRSCRATSALYNESKATGGGSAILPTPAIGGVGTAGRLHHIRHDRVQEHRRRHRSDRRAARRSGPVAVAARDQGPARMAPRPRVDLAAERPHW